MFVAEGTNIGRVKSQYTGPGCRNNGNFDWKGLTDTSKDMTKTTWICLSEQPTSRLKPCCNHTIGRMDKTHSWTDNK